MEATAASIPVAAYDIAGIDQLISHEKTGLLATLGDKQTLLSYWEKLLYDQPCATEMAENAKQFVYDNYSAQRMAAQYSDLFEEMTKDS